MEPICLRAHFDGTKILLDEPFQLQENAQLLVTVLSTATDNGQVSGWPEFAATGLGRAYGEDEPAYSAADIIP
jgi:hypothetical protein